MKYCWRFLSLAVSDTIIRVLSDLSLLLMACKSLLYAELTYKICVGITSLTLLNCWTLNGLPFILLLLSLIFMSSLYSGAVVPYTPIEYSSV